MHIILFLIIGLSQAAPSPMPPPGADAYFPYEHGDRFVYATYYASRKHGGKVWSSTASWEEVVAEDAVHGFTVFVLQQSNAAFDVKTKKFGPPQAVVGESVYVLTSEGVALTRVYSLPGGTVQDYAEKRAALLNGMRSLKRSDFIALLSNWVLPFPLKAGTTRESPGVSYKILKGGAKHFIPAGKRKATLGAAGYVAKRWAMTRWFEEGTGLLVYEEDNSDEGVDRGEYPFKVRSLLKTFKYADAR